ncbi:hypothetical protein DFJ43DRAFT_1189539 [Lentinula guzmanii]|uniref:Uncharacterized protein n=1 Tax=Lentinula guzmanii TaxID=2804957 RepID=A0AA38MYG9_9AGAR|nr:hypothetical protein DFJ43DRAFT_1189539 [Lentinula guzmanii]
MLGSVIAAFSGISLLVLARVSTMPLPEIVPHQDVMHEVFERDRAFVDDQNLFLEPRDAESDSRCRDLTLAEAKTIPNWEGILAYADERYGKGSRNILMYDKHYPNVRPAKVCVPSQVVPIKLTGSPSCKTTNATDGGNISGTHGIASIMIQQGLTLTSSFTISDAASMGLTNAFRAKIKFPDFGSTRGGRQCLQRLPIRSPQSESSSTFALQPNFLVNFSLPSFEVKFDDMVTTTFNMTVKEGQTCQAMESVVSCTLQGTGEVPFIASGIIWFQYDDKTYDHIEYNEKKPHSKHYKSHVLAVQLNMTEVLPEAAQRTTTATFKGSFLTTSHGQYKAVCTGGDES